LHPLFGKDSLQISIIQEIFIDINIIFMTKFRDKTVLITGGASGIGKLMGRKLLEKGASKLIIWDINPEFLHKTTEEFSELGYKVFPYELDVANTEMVIATGELIKKEVGKVDILINNAGVVVGKEFKDHTHNDIDFTMSINTNAAMHVTLQFLKDMINDGRGHIVNIASAAGLLANPKMSVYVGSKWGITGWSESLRIELERLSRGLRVTTVNPSYINTGMFAGVKSPLMLPILHPEKAVNKIINAIEKDKLFVRMPLLVKFLPFVRGILPARTFDWFAGKVLGVYESMAGFAGHNYYKSADR